MFLVFLCKSGGALLRSPPQFSQVLLPKAVTGKENGIATIALD